MKPSRDVLAFAVLACGIVLTAAALISAWLSIEQLTETVRLEERAHAVLARVAAVASAVEAAEASRRENLARGDPDSALRFARYRARAERELNDLGAAVVDPAQKRRLADLVDAQARLFSILAATRARDPAAATDAAAAAAHLRQIVAAFVEEERVLLETRRARGQDILGVTQGLLAWSGTLAVLVLGAATLLLARYHRARARAQAERALAEQRLELALTGSALAVWDWDLQRNEVYLGPEWMEMLGEAGRPVTTTPEALASLVHPDDVAPVLAALASARKGADTYEVEHRVRTAGGNYRWIISRGKVTARSREGRALRMTGTNRDITARRLAEEELASRELRLRLVTDNAPVMIVELDENDRYRFCNRQYADYFGRSVEALRGQALRDVAGEEAYRRLTEAKPRLRAGETVVYEREARRHDGGADVLEIRIFPNRPGRRDYAGCYVVLNDVTERRRLERMKDEFVSTVSHELRTPLTSIRAALSLLSRGAAGDLPGAAAQLVQVAHVSCERLVRLVNNILDFQRIGSGRLELSIAEHDAAELARQTIAASEAFARERGVELLLDAESALVVRADADRVQQALTNLISNAAKHSPNGGKVRVEVRREADRVRYTVEDRGAGIPRAFQPRLFEAFSQAAPGTPSARGGTGLGLAITKALIEEMDGTLSFESEEKLGSRFWFDLPAGGS